MNRRSTIKHPTRDGTSPSNRRAPSIKLRCHGFTLTELLVVMGIIAILMVLVAPAFTTIKSGTDVTSAAYTIKGALDTARTYAKANNTYTWVGFYEENVSNPASPNSDTPAVGRLVMSIVASKDGTMIHAVPLTTLATLAPANLIEVGKLTKIDNVHLQTFPDATASPPPITFDTRLAIGVAAFCLIAVLGLLPVALKTQQASMQQTTANDVLSQILGDLRADIRLPPGQVSHEGEYGFGLHGHWAQMYAPDTLYFTNQAKIT